MKKKNIVLIALAAVVVLLAVVVAVRGSRKATFKQDYHVADVSSITRIFMADKQDQEVTLSKVADSLWMVDGKWVASQPMVDLLLETLNTMRIRQQVNRNAVPTMINDLAARAIKVEVYQRVPRINWFGGKVRLLPHEKLTVTYFVGRETPDMMASVMFREGDKVPYIIHIPGFRGYLTPRFIAEPMQWRSHSIVNLDVHAIERVELQIPGSPNDGFAVQRNGDGFDFLLRGQEKVAGFDTARVAQMLSAFTFLNFDEFAAIVPNSFADSCVSGTPRTVLSVTDTAGTTTTLRTFIKYENPDDLMVMPDPEMNETFDLDRLYAIIDQRDTVLIQYFIFDNILQPASYFMGQDKQLIAR